MQHLSLSVEAGSLVIDCTVDGNGGDGIHMGGSGLVSGNICELNAAGAGIWVWERTRVINNVCRKNATGMRAGAVSNVVRDNTRAGILVSTANTRNVVIGNSAGDNGGSSYALASGNDVGPIGTAASATSPFANLLN